MIPRNQLTRLIGLTGQAGSGKSTVAQYLGKHYGYTELTFAGHLKRSLAFIFGVDVRVFHDPDLKNRPLVGLFGKTPREVMLSFGTGWARDMVCQDMWVVQLEAHVSNLLSLPNVRLVVSDVRLENEAQLIKRYHGAIWQIERPGNPLPVPEHRTEHGLHPHYIDRVIVNDDTLEQLYSVVDNLAIATHNSDMTTT